jgi:Zn-dependent M32 family carboxypeptidase
MGLNEVFRKVADIERNATELASHEVNLSLESDLVGTSKKIAQGNKDVLEMNKNILLLKNEYDALNKVVSDKIATITRLQKSVETSYANNSKAYSGVAKFALGLKTKVETSAKDLGVNPNTFPLYTALLNEINNNMWLSMMNISTKDYFFRDANSAKSTLTTNISKLK